MSNSMIANSFSISLSLSIQYVLVDVCGTVSKYFSGVNIPLESIGKAFPNTDNLIHRYKVLKSNTILIKQLVDLKNFPYDKMSFQQAITDGNHALAVDKMEQFIVSVKAPLIDFKRFPTSELFIIGIVIVISQARRPSIHLSYLI